MIDKIIERELSYRVNGCVFDVHNEVGPGIREECYQKAMEQTHLRLTHCAIRIVVCFGKTKFMIRGVRP